ncbi:sodium:proton antiporter [Pseudomonas tremae]|uniref:cation:proton antiporter n=1 Tax=Pseudomonas syringae group TaxID=136849 RepID=UPI0006ABAC38|nr:MULTISPECIES: sodium:proton antiporter [Pseudomonas syringae group]KOP53009.1 sodium:proton antiporter [Pseudomonas coronafaciens pv. porri]KPY19954.1 Sodium/hydrogen exchanger [Pseudomonas coronafaciens pv. porri]MCQ3028401.1 sodium:proton antiporter [Pseudomonas tremae]RMS14329.1 Sodium/hydrogen exchanger [Pseudomonas coronafaciens pv. coronafaciens]RMU79407.1 Sodium/hydrogen exchanger [Pseudomonas coronafaciens pv. porri]
MLELAAGFICLTALLTYVNYRFIGLPPTIGVMVTALMFSLLLQGLSFLGYPGLEDRVQQLIGQIDFGDLLMNWMLSFLLFAGALHVNLGDLRSYRWPIGLLATFGVLIATTVIGALAYWIFALFGWHVSPLYCLLFGALISPTDPIAVLGVLRTANASKPLKTTIVGESLFNDGTAVVVFTVLLGIAQLGETPTVGETALLFVHEAVGGVLFGGLIGYAVYLMIKSIEQYQIEVMLTLALVIGGSAMASELHVSGPIAMVVAGLIIGNLGRNLAMNDMTRRYMDGFWELLDDMLNALLFALIGMELLLLPFSWQHLIAASLLAVAILLSRFVTVAPAILLLRRWRNVPHGTIRILTWGGLRGGVSVALALALPTGPERDLLLSITYIVVLLSILLQGLTIGKLVHAVTRSPQAKGPAEH